MLRRVPRIAGHLQLYRAQSQQQRLFWGRTSGVSAWLGFGSSSNSDVAPDKASSKPPRSPPSTQDLALGASSVGGHASSRRTKTKRSRKRKQLWLRSSPPQNAAFPKVHSLVGASKRRAAEEAAAALLSHLQSVSTSAKLLSFWQTVSQYRLFVLSDGDLRLASSYDAGAPDGARTQGTSERTSPLAPLLQMVPADVFALLSATSDANPQALVGSSGGAPAGKRGSRTKSAPVTDVILVNESVVVATIVRVLCGLGSHTHAVSLFETYDGARRVWLEEQLLSLATASGDGEEMQLSQLLVALERATRLDPRAYVAYLRSLGVQKQAFKLQALVESDMRHLQATCRLGQSEAALTMVRHWLQVVDDVTKSDSAHLAAVFHARRPRSAPKINTNSGVSHAERCQHVAREELLHFAFGELLAEKHSTSVLKEALGGMHSSKVLCRSATLKMAVAALLESDKEESALPSDHVVKNSLTFWQQHSSVVADRGYLVRLLLEECLRRQWYDECESVLDFLVRQRLPRVPCAAIVKVMKANELHGRFAANAEIGRKLLTGLVRTARHGLDADFYERYLTSCVHLERFQAVRQLRGQQNLTRRFPRNKVIHSLLLSM